MNYYIKNSKRKEKSAIALGYDTSSDAVPRILATGKNNLAKRILEIAAQENIPIHEDKDLLNILSLLEVGSYIPYEAYGAVAKILSHINNFKEELEDE